jgi:hypothetical protein
MIHNKLFLPKSLLSTIFIIVLLLITSPLVATPLSDSDLVIIIKSGTNSDGTFRYEVADSSDQRAAQIWDISQKEAAMIKVADYYSDLQQPDNANLSSDEQNLLNFYGNNDRDPVYIEIVEGSSGAYCDWKADFTLQTADGTIERCITPKVVLNRNDPLFTGTDRGLQTQTLVHEIGHGAMSKLYGYDSLPYTEWLHKSHSGGTVSDEKLAIIEGWAEFAGAYFTGDHTIANDPDNSMSDNRYAYTDIYAKTEVRSASNLKKTEGWVASTLLRLVESNVVTIDDMNQAMSNGTPQTFDALTAEVIKIRPENRDAIKTTIAEASMGKIYPDYYTTVADYTVPDYTAVNSGTSYDNPYTNTFVPNDANYPDFSLNQNGESGSNKKLFAVITGTLLGALAGAPFGIVGVAVGAVAGLVIGNLIGDNMASESYVATPIITGTSAPEVTGNDGNPQEPLHSSDPAGSNLVELRSDTDKAFNLYLNAVQHGTIDEQKSSLENYRTIHKQYRNILMKKRD